MTTTELAQTIQDRLEVLYREIAVLEAARNELHANGSVPSAPARDKPKAVRPRRRATRKRRTEAVPTGRLEGMLAEHDGVTTTALATLANAERDQVLALLRELEAAGRARRTGERRGTRWHAITDEDRIRARAAELEQQSKRARSGAKRARRTA
jgi:hypothetical protein